MELIIVLRHNPIGFMLVFGLIAILGIVFLLLTFLINSARRSKYTRLFENLSNGSEDPDELFKDFHFTCAKENLSHPVSISIVESVLEALKNENFEENGISFSDFKYIENQTFCFLTKSKKSVSYMPGGGDYFSVNLDCYELWRLQFNPDLNKAMITSTVRHEKKDRTPSIAFANELLRRIA